MFKAYFVCFMIVFSFASMAHNQPKPVLPSQVLAQTKQTVRSMIMAQTLDAAKAYDHGTELIKARVSDITPQSLNRGELFLFTTILTRIDRTHEAKTYLQALMKGKDLPAQRAWAKWLELLCREKRYAEVEHLMARYKENFPPNPAFTEDISAVFYYLGPYYQQQNQSETAVALYLEELKRLPGTAPYHAFYHLDSFWPFFKETGRSNDLRLLAKTKLARLKDTHKNMKTEDEKHASMTQLIGAMERAFIQFELIGKPAPALRFSATFNTQPLTIEALKGNVVILDFWATWCGGCLVGFPKLADLYQRFGGDNFEILGITSIYETPKDRMAPFLKKHKITWPIAIMEESVHSLKSYGIGGLPTYVVLDKKGIIRYLDSGTTKNLSQIVSQLLAE